MERELAGRIGIASRFFDRYFFVAMRFSAGEHALGQTRESSADQKMVKQAF